MTIWDEWGRVTRFLQSARIAFAREDRLWGTIELADPSVAEVRVTRGESQYRVSLKQHREAVLDEQILFASVLIHSHALVEAGASDRLGANASEMGGIEDWGNRLLTAAGTSWSEVLGGKAGLVEVATIRNCLSHGAHTMDKKGFNRIRDADPATPWTAGAPIILTLENLEIYRARLRSLLRLGGVK
ncbi:MAG: hypothetical protein ACK5ZS_01130 [bacterium]|jgi:hypothetical protein